MVNNRRSSWGVACAAAVIATAGSVGAAAENSAVRAALNTITSAELGHHVDVLAADTFEGREAGSRGGRAAGGYLVQLLEENHIQPAGEDGGYFQSFDSGYRNILGMIPGRDPQLQREFIVIGGTLRSRRLRHAAKQLRAHGRDPQRGRRQRQWYRRRPGNTAGVHDAARSTAPLHPVRLLGW